MKSHTPRLQKYQRNDIVKAMQIIGLDPREFDMHDDGTEARITHRWSEAYFIISGGPREYVGHSQSGDWPAFPYKEYGWTPVEVRVKSWLDDVKRDIETPDLWAELQGEAKLLGAASDEATENTPFTSQEKKEIVGQLNEFAEYAQHTYSLSTTQMSDLNAKLDYLAKATDRLGRIDWRNIFIGSIFSFVIAAALSPESARDMFFILMRGIHTILLHGN